MKLLIEAARIAFETKQQNKNFLLGCIAQRKDGVFVRSTNSTVRVPTPSAHAESRVLRKAGYGATLWVARVIRDGSWALAKPCIDCQILIKNRGVKRVYYTIGPNEYGVWELGIK